MTRPEYGIQYWCEDGTWHGPVAGDAALTGTPDGVVAILDRFRKRWPNVEWRVVTRTIPDWEPADEAALRDGSVVTDRLPIPEAERVDMADTTAALVGWWCERGGGHVTAQGCNSGSLPLYAPAGEDAGTVRAWITERDHQ